MEITKLRLSIALFFLTAPLPANALLTDDECKECHIEIYREWEKTSHATSYTNPLFQNTTNNYKVKGCLHCHSSEPILETGVDKKPLLRKTNRTRGVSCLTCHKFNDKMHGSIKQPDQQALCQPAYDVKLEKGEICFSCHKDETREWKETTYFKKGSTCLTCHMEKVKGKVTKGKQPAEYGEHKWAGGNNPLFLESVIKDIELLQDKMDITVRFKPYNVGHNFPTGTSGNPSFHILLIVMDSERKVKKLFRKNFIRTHDTNKKDTSIKGDEEIFLRFPLPTKRGTINFVVFYKTYSNQSDSDAIILKNSIYEFNDI